MIDATPVIGTEQAAEAALKVELDWRPLLFFIQARSMEPGGCRNLAMELILNYRDKIGPTELHQARLENRRLTSDECQSVEDKLDLSSPSFDQLDAAYYLLSDEEAERREARRAEEKAAIRRQYQIMSRRPNVIDELHRAAVYEAERRLPDALYRICIDGPDKVCFGVKDQWPASPGLLEWFPSFKECLRNYCEQYQGSENSAQTSIRNQVWDCLDDTWHNRGFAIIHGNARIGKTTSARAWVSANIDKARYFSMEASGSMAAFYRELAVALGCTPYSYQSKNEEVIAQALRGGNLMLVIDEAHLLTGTARKANLSRLEWLRTSLINKGVPVALMTTPQFVDRVNQAGDDTGFNISQFQGRITNPVILPECPEPEDFFAVAAALAPDADQKAIKTLAGYGMSSLFYFQAIHRATQEARRIAKGGEPWQGKIAEAVSRCMNLDNTFNAGFIGKPKPKRSKRQPDLKPTATPVKEHCTDPEKRLERTTFLPDRSRPAMVPTTW